MVDTATALTNKLTEVLTAGDSVPAGSFISLVGGGRPISQEDVEWAKTDPPYNGTAEASAAKRFTQTANTIPIAVGSWFDSTSNIDTLYRTFWLEQAHVSDVALTDAQKKERDDAKKFTKDNYQDYHKRQQAWRAANTALQVAVRASRDDPNYLNNLDQARANLNDALDDWVVNGSKNEYENANTTYQYYTRVGLKGALIAFKKEYDDIENENRPAGGGANFVPITLIPNDFLDQGWTTFHLESNETEQYTHNNRTDVSAGVNLNALFWTASAQVKYSNATTYNNVQTDDIVVDFEIARVHLGRFDWFNGVPLLQSTSWWWPEATKAQPTKGVFIFSDGAPPPSTTGNWEMIPTEMIVARNLTVTTKNHNLQESTWAQNVEVSAKAGFWIFTTEAKAQNAEEKTFKHEFTDNSTLKADQPQILAFICELMPKEPNPDITLLPA
jgi:hypothetical protein